jgi:hypothetical protein
MMLGPTETDTAVALRADKTRGSSTSDDSEDRTTSTLVERASGRAALQRESGRDLVEVIREANRRADV